MTTCVCRPARPDAHAVGPEADPLALDERRLSLFSVSSQNGELEVNLMGQRLSLSLPPTTR